MGNIEVGKEKIKIVRPEAKKILEYNRKRLYKLPKKFADLEEALRPEVKNFLLDMISFWLKTDCIAYGSHDMVYFLGTKKGTYEIREKTTRGVTNRYINYLCALGLLRKIKQLIIEGYDQKERRFFRKNLISKVNVNVLKYDKNYNKRSYNTFELIKYTSELLEECNTRAKLLLDKKITPGNMSYNQLAINGLEDMAQEVYLEDKSYAVQKKEREYGYLLECINMLITENGYATKEDIRTNLLLSNGEIKRLFVIYKNDLWQIYNYKRPTAKEKEQYNLDSDNWIITVKEG